MSIPGIAENGLLATGSGQQATARDPKLSRFPIQQYAFTDSIPVYAKNIKPHMYSQTLEAISDMLTMGGQSIIGKMRESRNKDRLADSGVTLDNNIPSKLTPQQDKALVATGSLVTFSPSALNNLNLPSPGSYTSTTPATIAQIVSPPGVSTATAFAYVTPGTPGTGEITQVVVTNPGGGYTAVPGITVIDNPQRIVGDPPINMVAPNLTGTPAVGEILTCDKKNWSGVEPITYEYNWMWEDLTSIGNESTYTVGVGDTGHIINCHVIGTNIFGWSEAISNSTLVIGGGGGTGGVPPSNTFPPQIFGLPTLGAILNCDKGFWIGSPAVVYSYQWKRGIVNIGTNSDKYTMTTDDIGSIITCEVTGTNGYGSSVAASNRLGSDIGGFPPINTGIPYHSGTMMEYHTLTCSTGTWLGTEPVVLTYQWQRDTIDISGATDNFYALALSDVTHSVRCMVTGTNRYGSSDAISTNTLDIGGGAQLVVTVTAGGVSDITVTSPGIGYTNPAVEIDSSTTTQTGPLPATYTPSEAVNNVTDCYCADWAI